MFGMGKKVALAALAIAGTMGGLSTPAVAAASPAAAPAAVGCQNWSDQNTFGVTCTDVVRFRAVSRCDDGNWYQGPWVTSGWSYVYCAGHGGKPSGGYGDWRTN